MAVIGTVLYRRLVVEKSGLSPEVVAKVMDTANDVLLHLLQSGAQVRLGTLGVFQKVKTKATRRRLPGASQLMEVPEREKIVFKETRST
jgi:nucleoid DNA-binding protein